MKHRNTWAHKWLFLWRRQCGLVDRAPDWDSEEFPALLLCRPHLCASISPSVITILTTLVNTWRSTDEKS